MTDLPSSRTEAKNKNSLRYFTGKPCLNGHISERQTSNGCCYSCFNEKSSLPEAKIKRKKYGATHYEKNREERLAYQKNYRQENREKFTQWMAKWRINNPEKNKISKRISQSKRRAACANSSILKEDFSLWLNSASKICYWCDIDCQADYHVDHYKPLCKGGMHALFNLVISCKTCNLRKNSKDPFDFLQQIGKLLLIGKHKHPD